MFRKFATALIASLVISGTVVSSVVPAEAQYIYRRGMGYGGWGHGGWGHGGRGWRDHDNGWGWGGAAAAGLLGGVILGSALAPRYDYGYGYGYGGPVYAGPSCYWTRQRFFDGYYWRVRRVEICN